MFGKSSPKKNQDISNPLLNSEQADENGGYNKNQDVVQHHPHTELTLKDLMTDKVDVVDEHTSRLSHSSSFSATHPTNSPQLTTFLLLNTMIGSGILNQPYVFRQSGIIAGIFAFVLASIGIWTGLMCLTSAGVYANVLEYSGLATFAFDRNGDRLVDVSIIVLTFGSQLGYILVVGTTLADLLSSWGCDFVLCDAFFTTIVSVGLFVAPVCMFRHFGHLAYLSLFSIAAIVAVLLLVLIGGPIKHVQEEGNGINDPNLASTTGLLTSIGSIVFSLACASANFQAFISTEKHARNLETWSWVTGTAVVAGTLMCMVMGVVGYLSFGGSTQGMILDNFPQHGFDFFKVMVVTHLILYIPVNFVIMRYSIVKMCTGMRSELLPSGVHTILTLSLLAGTTAVVLILMGIGLGSGAVFSLILNITGGIGGSLANLILPAAIYLKVMPYDSDLYKPSIVLLIGGLFVLVSVVTFTIIELMSA